MKNTLHGKMIKCVCAEVKIISTNSIKTKWKTEKQKKKKKLKWE